MDEFDTLSCKFDELAKLYDEIVELDEFSCKFDKLIKSRISLMS